MKKLFALLVIFCTVFMTACGVSASALSSGSDKTSSRKNNDVDVEDEIEEADTVDDSNEDIEASFDNEPSEVTSFEVDPATFEEEPNNPQEYDEVGSGKDVTIAFTADLQMYQREEAMFPGKIVTRYYREEEFPAESTPDPSVYSAFVNNESRTFDLSGYVASLPGCSMSQENNYEVVVRRGETVFLVEIYSGGLVCVYYVDCDNLPCDVGFLNYYGDPHSNFYVLVDGQTTFEVLEDSIPIIANTIWYLSTADVVDLRLLPSGEDYTFDVRTGPVVYRLSEPDVLNTDKMGPPVDNLDWQLVIGQP